MQDFNSYVNSQKGKEQEAIKGMDKNEAIKRLSGIKCGFKDTSCPDQISKALAKE